MFSLLLLALSLDDLDGLILGHASHLALAVAEGHCKAGVCALHQVGVERCQEELRTWTLQASHWICVGSAQL